MLGHLLSRDGEAVVVDAVVVEFIALGHFLSDEEEELEVMLGSSRCLVFHQEEVEAVKRTRAPLRGF